ncbi:unnamed protein product [Chrysoparadoxa australica]
MPQMLMEIQPCFSTAVYGYSGTMQMLLERGADPEKQTILSGNITCRDNAMQGCVTSRNDKSEVFADVPEHKRKKVLAVLHQWFASVVCISGPFGTPCGCQRSCPSR